MPDEPLHLTKAPIVEAVIGIDFDPLPPDVVAKFPLVVEELAPRYHQPTPIFEQKPNLTGADRCHPRTKLVHLA